MNIYNYFYNNVVDFNNAINSRWPQSEDRVTDGNEGNLPTGKDELSTLPPEILNEMMTHLPLESVQALSLTNHKIRPTTEPVIKFRTNLKNQTLLEDFCIKTIKSIHFGDDYIGVEKKIFKEAFEKAITFQNGSNERAQALRDAICSIYQEKVTLEYLSTPLYYANEDIFKDKFLVQQLMKGLTYENGRCEFKFCDAIFESCRDKIQNEIVFLNLLKTNQIHISKLVVGFAPVNSVPVKIIEALVDALAENQSINKVCIVWVDCDLKQLDAILETISNNERILEFQIEDIGSKRNYTGTEWSFQKSAKEKNYKEFEDLIKNKLNPTFQISETDFENGFFCQRSL